MTATAALLTRLLGSLVLIGSSLLNVAARIVIGRFWSDQIEIQKDHRVITVWPYSLCRHPMYGSLLIFGVGMGMIMLNPLVIGTMLLLFLPAVAYRAQKEEEMLLVELGKPYTDYAGRHPMLFPAFPEKLSRLLRLIPAGLMSAGMLRQDPEILWLAAWVIFGLSFLMCRPHLGNAYRFKALLITVLLLASQHFPGIFPLLWLPTASTLISVSGHCPGSLLLQKLDRNSRRK